MPFGVNGSFQSTKGGGFEMGLNVELVRQSFATVAPHGDRLVELFYRNLFDDYPALECLFVNADTSDQKKMLLASLEFAVGNLSRPDVLVPALERLGRRHAGYGAEEMYYPAVEATLLKTLAEVAGDNWTDEMNEAWAQALTKISRHMLDGAAVEVD